MRKDGVAVAAIVFALVATGGVLGLAPAALEWSAEEGPPDAASAPADEPLVEESYGGRLDVTRLPVAGDAPGGKPERAHMFGVPDGAMALRADVRWSGTAALALVVEVSRFGSDWERVASASGASPLQAEAPELPDGVTDARVRVFVDGGRGPQEAEYGGALVFLGSGSGDG